MENLYEILEIDKNASQDEIKKSYRKLVKKYHPDTHKNDSNTEEQFKKINAAYSVLSDPEKRQQYDYYGTVDGQEINNANFDDIFGNIFGDVFSFGGAAGFGPFGVNINNRNNSGPIRGNDLKRVLNITLLDAYIGNSIKHTITKWKKCKSCNGSGAQKGTLPERCKQCNGSGQIKQQIKRSNFSQMITFTTCPICKGNGTVITKYCEDCKGEGYISEDHIIDIKIPKGIQAGMQLRVADAGSHGINGGAPGDLFLIINIIEDSQFKRDDNDLYMNLYITWPDAVLGKSIDIVTIDKTIEKVNILPGIQQDEVIVIENKGMPYMRNPTIFGDLYLIVKIDVPKVLTDKERELIKELSTTIQTKSQ